MELSNVEHNPGKGCNSINFYKSRLPAQQSLSLALSCAILFSTFMNPGLAAVVNTGSKPKAKPAHQAAVKTTKAKSNRSQIKTNHKPQAQKSQSRSTIVASKKNNAIPYRSVSIAPQSFIPKLNRLTLKPGVVHWSFQGPLNINVIDIDLKRADVKVRPYLASSSFANLKTTEQQAADSGALIAVNTNYFKTDGTPLGAVKIDGEWIAGSLFNRVAMGFSDNGKVSFARVNLHGILESENPEIGTIWVNNMNQPRRTGTRAILFTRRWGDSVNLPYKGIVVAVDRNGQVVDSHERAARIPDGGYVITDREGSKLELLKKGEHVSLSWYTDPPEWDECEHAISGGPTLIKEGELFIGLQGEQFPLSWTSNKITRRTACGYTGNKHLIIATIEGPHNMWDLAKFMQQFGCVEAMNLDGGGSTTMVIGGKTVTQNKSGQRKVATTITVMEPHIADKHRMVSRARFDPLYNQQAPTTIAKQNPEPEPEKKIIAPPIESDIVGELSENAAVIAIDNDLFQHVDKSKTQKKDRKQLRSMNSKQQEPKISNIGFLNLGRPSALSKTSDSSPMLEKRPQSLSEDLIPSALSNSSQATTSFVEATGSSERPRLSAKSNPLLVIPEDDSKEKSWKTRLRLKNKFGAN